MELIEALFIFQTIVDITAICVHAWIFALCFKKGLYIAKQYIYASCVTSTLILFLNGIFNRVRVYAITAPWLLWMYRLVADAKVALVEYVIFHYLVKSAVTAAFANAIVKCFAQKYRKKMGKNLPDYTIYLIAFLFPLPFSIYLTVYVLRPLNASRVMQSYQQVQAVSGTYLFLVNVATAILLYCRAIYQSLQYTIGHKLQAIGKVTAIMGFYFAINAMEIYSSTVFTQPRLIILHNVHYFNTGYELFAIFAPLFSVYANKEKVRLTKKQQLIKY